MSDQPKTTPDAAPTPNTDNNPQQETTKAEEATSSTATAHHASTEAPQPQPQDETKKEDTSAPAATPPQPDYIAKNPALGQLADRLPAILSNTGHSEMWGVPLKDVNDVPTVNVLIKFLRANEGNVKLAEEQLAGALKWRKEANPTALVESTAFNKSKFEGLGYLTKWVDEDGKEVITTWNIYGAVKDMDVTFGDIDEFIRWRAALMEMATRELKLADSTTVIDYDGEDPYQMLQVHDYLNVSFFRPNPNVRATTKKTIEIFSMAYPELLREKFFVNVPTIMGWMFAAIKVFVSKATARKFHPISNGANLAREFPSPVKEKFPKCYGGQGPDLEGNAQTVTLEEKEEKAPASEPKATEPAKEEDAVQENKPKEEEHKPAEAESKAETAEAPKEEPKGESTNTDSAEKAPEGEASTAEAK